MPTPSDTTIPPGKTLGPSPSVVAPTIRPTRPTEFTIETVDRPFFDVGALTSTGRQILWADEVGSIWQSSPADPAPVRVFENAVQGAQVMDIAADDGGFAFSQRLLEPEGGWRVWYMSADSNDGLMIDEGISRGIGPPPTLAIDAERVVWTGFDQPGGTSVSFVNVADRADLAAPRTLFSVPITDGLLWYPDLDGSTLWYGIIDPDVDATGVGDEIHIETVDLANPSAAPVRFDGPGNDFNPVVSPEYVIWKTLPAGLSALTWGQLNILNRQSDETSRIPAENLNNPSLGARFVAFQEISNEKLLLYDLASRSLIEIPDTKQASGAIVDQVALSGNLLAFVAADEGRSTIHWATLPD